MREADFALEARPDLRYCEGLDAGGVDGGGPGQVYVDHFGGVGDV